jgi:hypothetical protein
VTLPSKEELLERERRWLRPAGIVAIAGTFVFAIGVVIQQVSLERADTDPERLQQFHDHASQLLVGQVLQGLGVGLFAVPLLFLFRAAAARSDRVRRTLLPLVVLGPLLFFIATSIVSVGISDVADTFVEEVPAREQEARQEAKAEQKTPEEQDQAANDASETFADDVGEDSSTVQVGAGLRTTATFALIFGLIYVPLWAMRTGLLTRFWATLGMALGVSLILLGAFGYMGLVLWFAAIGLMLAGWWPGSRPPAWEAGVAIPWPKPGEEPGEPGPVEGSGREVSEPPLPDEVVAPEDRPPGESQGQRRKKRKRRG